MEGRQFTVQGLTRCMYLINKIATTILQFMWKNIKHRGGAQIHAQVPIHAHP